MPLAEALPPSINVWIGPETRPDAVTSDSESDSECVLRSESYSVARLLNVLRNACSSELNSAKFETFDSVSSVKRLDRSWLARRTFSPGSSVVVYSRSPRARPSVQRLTERR